MQKVGFDFPAEPRRTLLTAVEEEWYQPLLAAKLGRTLEPIKRSNFGEYAMAVNYITSVLEEAKAIEKVAVYNIDHMAQVLFTGKDAEELLDRALPANIASMKIGQCKYTLLLNQQGGVQDDMIVMKQAADRFILVINAGHDLTGKGMSHGEEVELISDADRILQCLLPGEFVEVKDISADFAKIDIQGPYSYKLVKALYGEEVLKNRNNPEKNMNFFSFNEFDYEGHSYILSRTGYTNRWGWELYVPAPVAAEQFKRIVSMALELGGLLVGLGGRDENRTSAGAVGLPLMGQEYDPIHTPLNAPLFHAAVDMDKAGFVGKFALEAEIANGIDKKMALVITEGIVVGRGVYKDGKRLGVCTSSINSPNVPLEKRLAIGSTRKAVIDENGTCAIGLVWLKDNPFMIDEEGADITETEGRPVRIPVEFYREDIEKNPQGKPVMGYITLEGITPATAPKPLKQIENL